MRHSNMCHCLSAWAARERGGGGCAFQSVGNQLDLGVYSKHYHIGPRFHSRSTFLRGARFAAMFIGTLRFAGYPP